MGLECTPGAARRGMLLEMARPLQMARPGLGTCTATAQRTCVPCHPPPQESGDALLQRLRAGQAPAAAAAAPAVQELSPAEAAKDEGNKAFKRGDWQAAVAHYSRWGRGGGCRLGSGDPAGASQAR